VRKTITLVALLAIVAGAGYLFVFKRDAVLGLLGMARGYGPAKTPDEALDKFKKAVKDRDYATAGKYCGGTYGEQLRRSADAAKELGKALDSVTYNADKRGITLTDRSKALLLVLEPFPVDFEVADVKKQDDEHATATLLYKNHWKVPAELKPEGDGGERGWRIFIATTPWLLRGSVDQLLDKHKDYARALEKVSDQIKSKEITTKDDLEQKLDAELKAAAK
jgi:hypothetical protein